MSFRQVTVGATFLSAGLLLSGQTANVAHPTPIAATAPTVVPALIPYSGIAEGNHGSLLTGEVSVTFLLFKDESGGEPMWVESQRVSVDATGRYSVQLGAGSPYGIPLTVFASGEARWLEVQVTGQKPQARVLLSSVPYAAKAADSATLGGLPASAFVLAGTPTAPALVSPAVTPDAGSTVTTTGGTTNYFPLFTGTSTIANSVIVQDGASIGIGKVPNTSAALDVNGGMIMRGGMTVSRTGNATSSEAYPSFPFGFYSNVYDSSSKGTDNPHFLLQSEPTGNNTANTGATFNLLYSNHGNAPSETGLSINPTGILHFATGQTFPGTGTGNGTITKVTAGTGLSGGGSSGAVTLTNAGLLALTAGSGLKSSGGQSPTLTIDTTKIPTLTDSPTFTGSLTVNNNSTFAVVGNGTNGAIGVYGTSDTGYAGYFKSASTGPTVYSTNKASSGGFGLYGISAGTDGFGIYGEADGNGGYAVFGRATGSVDAASQSAVGVYGLAGNGYAVRGDAGDFGIGVAGHGTSGYGVLGTATTGDAAYFMASSGIGGYFEGDGAGEAIMAYNASSGNGVTSTTINGNGVLGVTSGESNEFIMLNSDGVIGGVWGDTSSSTPFAGVLGTADDNDAGYFANNSANSATIFAVNSSSGGTGLFKTLQATSHEGTCGIGSGNLSCTGQMKSLVSTNGGARTVETYAMQSPENWMEDFGSGKLSDGVAVVTIDPAFAETANTAADYFVFLTPRGDSKGLYVVSQTGTTFEVRESGGGASSLGFAYRIVAKRRGYETQRLKDVSETFIAETGADARRIELTRTQRGRRTSPVIPKPPAERFMQPGRVPQRPSEIRPVAAATRRPNAAN